RLGLAALRDPLVLLGEPIGVLVELLGLPLELLRPLPELLGLALVLGALGLRELLLSVHGAAGKHRRGGEHAVHSSSRDFRLSHRLLLFPFSGTMQGRCQGVWGASPTRFRGAYGAGTARPSNVNTTPSSVRSAAFWNPLRSEERRVGTEGRSRGAWARGNAAT